MDPLVSVVIPVFNQERFIAEAIESVLSQTYPRIELIVVDDGSTDSTRDVIGRYHGRLVYLHQANAGASVALNVGIQRAQGELVGWLSSDDVYFPTKVALQVEQFTREPEIGLSYTDFQVIDGRGSVLKTVRSPYVEDRKEFIRRMILGNFVNGSSVLVKRTVLEEVGPFDPELRYHADGNMWLRILKRHRFGHVPQILLKYRTHPGAASRNTREMHRYRQIFFSKIWETYSAADLFPDPGPDSRSAQAQLDRFMARALEANGLFSLAWRRTPPGVRSLPRYGRLAWRALDRAARETALRYLFWIRSFRVDRPAVGRSSVGRGSR